MGWAGSLVVLVVSIGLPEQGAYQLLPMLPFVLPLVCDLVFSADVGSKTTGSNVVVGRRKTRRSSGRLLYEPSFLTASQPFCLSVWRIQWFKMSCFSLANRVNGALLPATLNITPSRRVNTIYAWDTDGYSLSRK